MPASIGINGTIPSGMVPTNGVASEMQVQESVELRGIKNKSGVTSLVGILRHKKIQTTVSGYGDGTALFSSIAAGAYTNGEKVVEVQHSESNEDFPRFRVSHEKLEDI